MLEIPNKWEPEGACHPQCPRYELTLRIQINWNSALLRWMVKSRANYWISNLYKTQESPVLLLLMKVNWVVRWSHMSRAPGSPGARSSRSSDYFWADQCHLFAWAQISPSLSRLEGPGIIEDRTKTIWSISSPDFIIFNYT